MWNKEHEFVDVVKMKYESNKMLTALELIKLIDRKYCIETMQKYKLKYDLIAYRIWFYFP